MKLTGRARRRVGWSAAVVVLVAALIVAFGLVNHGTPAVAAASTTTVQRGTVTLAVAASGTVESAQTRGLSFAVAGTVTELDVKAGDLATAGQVLAKIDPSDAQAALDSAQQRYSDAQAAVNRATTTANLPICPTATPRPSSPTGNPSASPSAGASPHPSTTTASASSTSKASSETVSSSGGGGSSTPTCQQAGRTSTTDALLSAQQQLNNAALAVTRARAKLAGTVITAPISGRVLSVGGKVGSSASPGGSGFVVIGDIATMAVVAQFSEADVGRLAVGQVASITLPDRSDPLGGSVSQIDPAGTVSSRLVRYGVTLAFDSVPTDLLLGQSATVMVTTASAENVLYVSSSAVTDVAIGAGTVTLRTPAGDVHRSVTVGLRGDQYTEITQGLAAGDVVVLPTATT